MSSPGSVVVGSKRACVRIPLLIALLVLTIPATSYIQALTYPGHAGFAARSVEWIRGHGGNGLVNAIETWKYTHDAPTASGAPADIAFGQTASTRVKRASDEVYASLAVSQRPR